VSAARNSQAVLNDPPPPPARTRLVYGGEPLQFGDLRLPDGDGPHPLVVLIHGGAWKSTYNLIHAGHMAIALTADGYATFNIEYRRVGDPGGVWPGTYEDVLAAVDFARQIEGIDPQRVVIAGHSAGGQLALLAGADRRLPVIAMAANSDLVAWASDASRAFVDDARRLDASPRTRIPLGVRQIFIHGTEDDQVPFWVSTAFVDAASAAGDDATLVTLDGAGHFDMIDPQSNHWPRLVESVRALLG
jgi:acetyl esterase/lipase